MKPLEASIDVYGTYARASNLADYLELLALNKLAMTRATLAREIKSESWLVKMKELFDPGAVEQRDDFDDTDEPEDVVPDQPGYAEASRVFDLIDQRGDLLSGRYPFERVEDPSVPDGSTHSLRLRDGLDPLDDPYVALLCITIAHAYKLGLAPDPKQVLEDTVTRALERMGLHSVNVGLISRGPGGNFLDTVRRSGQSIGLQPTPSSEVSLVNANEEGVDCLGRLGGTDVRAGDWVFIGQVTCAMSDQWGAKLGEPKPMDWMGYLNTRLKPQPFLAVPHHVEDPHLAKLVKGGEGQILDRLRLVMNLETVSADEKLITEAVLNAPVAGLKVASKRAI